MQEAIDALVVMRETEGRFLEADLDARVGRSARWSTSSSAWRATGRSDLDDAAARTAGGAAGRPRGRSRGARAGGRALRRAVRRRRGSRPDARPPRALARPGRRARALRPQARLPAAGDEPRDQHDRIEGRGRPGDGNGDCRQGRARAAAGAGPECRVARARPRRRACCSWFPRRPAPERPPWSSGWWKCARSSCSRGPTRPGRREPGETDGVDYNFVDRPAFEAWSAGTASWNGPMSSAICMAPAAAETEALLAAGFDVVLVIDVQGARQVRARSAEAVGVFLLPPSFEVLESRLRGRSQDRRSGHRAAAGDGAGRSRARSTNTTTS